MTKLLDTCPKVWSAFAFCGRLCMLNRLPIYEIEDEMVARLRRQQRLLLSAPTGSGKSTQVPQMLLKHGLLDGVDAIKPGAGQVVILQPRRLAARLLAARVAHELGVQLGREVGYQIRFENVTSQQTRIRYVTEGILLRQMIEDPRLTGVSALIMDEFHERHLYGDITLARALDLQETSRPDLLLLVMSATLDLQPLARYMSEVRSRPAGFGTALEISNPVLTSEGRMYPVEIRYQAEPAYLDKRPVWERAADVFSEQIGRAEGGDALVFMPGAYEIAQTIESIRARPESKGFLLLPLHGELPPSEQDAAVARHSRPKVVVATNVAETSLTIDGVRLVIDSGLARIPRYDPYRGINVLLVEKISRASADQRAGRAGRTAPGICARLWSEREHAERALQELPEIKRLDLAEAVLTLKAAGVADLGKFRWLEAPDEKALEHAEELLIDLGALRAEPFTSAAPAQSNITSLGRRMLAFPAHPRYARMLLAAQEYGCVRQACLVAALTQGRDLLLRKVDKHVSGAREDLLGEKASSDFWILMRAWNYAARNGYELGACRKLGLHAVTARQVGPLFDQFLRIAREQGLDTEPRQVGDEALQKCILIGFSDRVGRRVDSGTLRCELVHGRRGVLARESAVQHSPLLVPAEVREVGQHGGDLHTIFSLATAIESAWLEELFPEDISRRQHVFYDASTKRVWAEEQLLFRDLPLDKRRVEPPPADAAARLLAEEVIAGRLALNEWNHSVEQWILRLNLLGKWCPEFELPSIADDDRRHLIEQLCHGALSYKEIKERPVKPLVQSWLSAPQRELVEKYAPERLELSNGRKPKLSYDASGSPFIALRIQELFEVTHLPQIALGRAPVLVHILAPNMRPVQVTQDLAGFWREHYPRVKSELQRKYPKHQWK
jgi:ATP-dependent helicase HrpB